MSDPDDLALPTVDRLVKAAFLLVRATDANNEPMKEKAMKLLLACAYSLGSAALAQAALDLKDKP